MENPRSPKNPKNSAKTLKNRQAHSKNANYRAGNVTSGKYQVKIDRFADVPQDVLRLLERFPIALEKIWPLKKKHRDNLPRDIARFSTVLTGARGFLEKNYWARPENVSAYLYYFLPWNLVRLTTLLNNLELAAPVGNQAQAAILCDVGAGPLTFPMALWLARPQWRNKAIHVFALDKIARPLILGKKLFGELANFTNEQPWRISCATGPLRTLAGKMGDALGKINQAVWLMTSVNVLNELKTARSKDDLSQEADMTEEDEEEKFLPLLSAWQTLWRNPESQLLFVEPGTRLGGSSIMLLRERASQLGLFPVAPCTHAGHCPMLKFSNNADVYQKRWCHFTFASVNAPEWLLKLSRESGLAKNSLSLSWLMLKNGQKAASKTEATVISQPFAIPGKKNKCVYACSERGLLLLEDDGMLKPGIVMEVAVPSKISRDAKSGAIII